jgi:hypothetical protein
MLFEQAATRDRTQADGFLGGLLLAGITPRPARDDQWCAAAERWPNLGER